MLKARLSTTFIVLGALLLTAPALGGSFYVLSCEAGSSDANTYEYGSDYHIIMENVPDGDIGTYFVEIYSESWFADPGLKSVGRWWQPAFVWQLRWVPSDPTDEPPFGLSGSAAVVINHDAGYGVLEGSGASVWTSGWGYSNSMAMQSSLGTFLDVTYEWSTPYGGEYSQNSAWLLDVPNIISTGYFQYDEVADDGSWIGYCTGVFQPYWVCATTDSEEEGTGSAVPQVYGSMNVLTVAGQSISSTTGGSTGGTSGTTSLGTGGADGGAQSAPASSGESTILFPLSLAFMFATALLVAARGRIH